MVFFSRVISYFSHPVWMPTLGLLLIYHTITPLTFWPFNRMVLLQITIIGTAILPLVFNPLMVQLGIIDSLEMRDRKARLVPYGATAFFYGLTFYLIQKSHATPPLIKAYALGFVMVAAAAFLLHFRWKISTHMMGLGGLTALLLYLSFMYRLDLTLLVSLITCLSGVVAFARLYLEAHTPREVYAGYITGGLIFLPALFVF